MSLDQMIHLFCLFTVYSHRIAPSSHNKILPTPIHSLTKLSNAHYSKLRGAWHFYRSYASYSSVKHLNNNEILYDELETYSLLELMSHMSSCVHFSQLRDKSIVWLLIVELFPAFIALRILLQNVSCYYSFNIRLHRKIVLVAILSALSYIEWRNFL